MSCFPQEYTPQSFIIYLKLKKQATQQNQATVMTRLMVFAQILKNKKQKNKTNKTNKQTNKNLQPKVATKKSLSNKVIVQNEGESFPVKQKLKESSPLYWPDKKC